MVGWNYVSIRSLLVAVDVNWEVIERGGMRKWKWIGC